MEEFIQLYYRQLCDAVSRGDFETAKHLVEKDERSSGHKTFLMRACQQANKPIVIFFLNSGAAVNKTTRWGWTALMYSAKAGDEDIFNLLLKNSADIMKKDWVGFIFNESILNCSVLCFCVFIHVFS
jgi:ankyrin repeat protein